MAANDAERAALSAAGRAMAAARRVVGPIICPECGRAVIATTAGRYKRQYCSPACSQRAYRRTHRAELGDYQRAYRQRRREGTAGARAGQEARMPSDPVTDADRAFASE